MVLKTVTGSNPSLIPVYSIRTTSKDFTSRSCMWTTSSSSADEGEESQVIQGFKDQYTIQDLGTLKHYLGITVEGLDDSVIVHQRSYGISIIKKFAHLISKRCRIGSGDGQSLQKKVKTPFPSGCRLSKMDKVIEA
jgi:hypothetical protein